MTFRERLAKEFPEYIGNSYFCGCFGCPVMHGYEAEAPDGCEDKTISCHECWNREMPETEENE